MRYDLAFFLCCCKSFLGDQSSEGEENYYQLLEIEADATLEQIKRAYKRQSLQMHPDKLAQRGQVVTEEDQDRFTRMKEAYECLSDPHKRETYDAIGAKGMKWIDEPFSVDPQELAVNFTKSSVLDRSKIFAIFVGVAVCVLVLPIVVCLHIDGVFGPDASWMATLVPLWLWNAFVLFFHSRVIMMPTMQKPEDVPQEEWVDPLPMKQRVYSLVKFLLIFVFELLLALKLDSIVNFKWAVVFVPLYLWEATNMYKKWPSASIRIVTIEGLEEIFGKSFSQFTAEEKESIGRLYSVVPSTSGPEFDQAQTLKMIARQDIWKSIFRALFWIVLVVQLETPAELNWWLIFAPVWIMICFVCKNDYEAFYEVQTMAAEKDPNLFGLSGDEEMGMPSEAGAMTGTTNATAASETGTTNYGSVGIDDAATPAATATTSQAPKLTEEEKERLKEQVVNSGSQFCTKCCGQFFIFILLCLAVSKLQGAGFSSLWIISPFLFAAGIILCCLGCAIFGITEMPNENDPNFDPSNFVNATVYGTEMTPNAASPTSGLATKNSGDGGEESETSPVPLEPSKDDDSKLEGLMKAPETSVVVEPTTEIRDLD